ncbi:MAG: heme-binding domain-containing protein [Gelidibacter sp.]|uniref:heme-binding domain-containing protein n=1 Tax=Gelidibacter sp. TaxID=2018083 RepID=UPI00326639BF
MKILKKLLVVFAIIIVVAQFFGPQRNEADMLSFEPFFKDTNPPEDVVYLLKETCFDCHSNVTRYPWYAKITPVNYWMASHVADGKKEFNISAWNGYSIKKKDKKFKELIEMVEKKEMPLKSYTFAHSEAKLSDAQIAAVVDWGKKVRLKYSLAPKPE